VQVRRALFLAITRARTIFPDKRSLTEISSPAEPLLKATPSTLTFMEGVSSEMVSTSLALTTGVRAISTASELLISGEGAEVARLGASSGTNTNLAGHAG